MFTPDVFGLGNPTPNSKQAWNFVLKTCPATTRSICLCWSQMAFLSLLDVHMIWYWLFHNHIYEPSVQLWPMIIYVWFLVKFCMKVILTFAQWFCPGRLSSKTTASFSISFQLLEADEAVPFILLLFVMPHLAMRNIVWSVTLIS